MQDNYDIRGNIYMKRYTTLSHSISYQIWIEGYCHDFVMETHSNISKFR